MLKIYTFGPGQIEVDGTTEINFATRKTVALLLYIACTATPQPRERLAELLWAERAPDQAQSNLRTALTRLNKQLGAYLEVTRYTVALNSAAAHWVDALALRAGLELLTTTRPWSALERDWVQTALDLYRGDFLAGFYVRDSPEFEAWLLLERATWQQQIALARLRLAQEYTAWGMFSAALAQAQQLTTEDPFNEEAHRLLMRLYAWTDQRHTALAQFERCRSMLAAELGLAPADETTALLRQIQAGEVTLPHPVAPPLDNLPQSPTPLVGRKHELTQIADLLADDRCRLVVLTGPGGAGKTRLALAAAHSLKERFAAGVCFVALENITDRAGIIAALASALRLQTADATADPLAGLERYLGTKSMLLVLDNCEQIANEVMFFARLLATVPAIKLLATSRIRLRLQEAWTVEVGGLADADASALRLFADRARRVAADFTLDPNDPTVAEICRLVDNLPLAIELAAAWVAALPLAEIARRVAADADFLAAPLANLPERQRSLRALFEQSWRLLNFAESGALVRLAMFRGSWTVEAAEQVAGANLPLLAGLVDRSLIRLRSDGRYAFHPLIRQFAREKLAAGEAEAVTMRRFLDYTISLAGPAAAEDQMSWFRRIEADYDNLTAALDMALARPETATDGLRLGQRLWLFWFRRGYWRDGLHWLRVGLNQTSGDTELRAHAFLLSSIFALRLGQIEPGVTLLNQGRQLAEALDFKEGLAIFFNSASFAATTYTEKAALLEQSLAYGRATPDSFSLPYALYLYGDTAREYGRVDQAEALYREALAVAASTGSLDVMTYAIGNLGRLAFLNGHLTYAKAQLEKAVALARETDNGVSIADWLLQLGRVTTYLAEYEQASAHLERCYALWQEIGSDLNRINAINGRADLALHQQQFPLAAQQLRASLAQAVEIWQQKPWQQTDAARGLADTLRLIGRLAAATRPDQTALGLLAAVAQMQAAVEYQLERPVQQAGQATLDTLRRQLSSEQYDAAWTQGRSQTLDEAIEQAYRVLG